MLRNCILAAALIICMISTVPMQADSMLETPPVLKPYVSDSPADDTRFFETIKKLVSSLSSQSIPMGTDLTSIQLFALAGSAYNVKDWETAQSMISFLFYTGEAGKAYQEYQDAVQRQLAPVDPGETKPGSTILYRGKRSLRIM